MRELTMDEVQDVSGGFGWIVVAIAAAILAGCGDEKPAPDARTCSVDEGSRADRVACAEAQAAANASRGR
jgi:lactobin A/cerein 7B family class IIb bacteriocin